MLRSKMSFTCKYMYSSWGRYLLLSRCIETCKLFAPWTNLFAIFPIIGPLALHYIRENITSLSILCQTVFTLGSSCYLNLANCGLIFYGFFRRYRRKLLSYITIEATDNERYNEKKILFVHNRISMMLCQQFELEFPERREHLALKKRFRRNTYFISNSAYNFLLFQY